MYFRWGILSVKPLIYKDFLVKVSPSLCVGVMEKSWKNEVRARSKFPNICIADFKSSFFRNLTRTVEYI